jgi:catechol 2,3-dioxygenase-like lactoylglutathione lyase family enzyme
MNIVVIHYAADPMRSSQFYQALGFPFLADKSDDHWREHEATGGTVALHQAGPDCPAGGHDLSFVTPEPLEAVAARLESKGFSSQLKDQPWGRVLRATDPDGTSVELSSSTAG